MPNDDAATVQGPGGTMPALGLGTWALRGRDCVTSVEAALDIGYRHLDTAQMYDNEEEVGRALRQAPVGREEVFLVTKVWQTHLDAAGVRNALESSLRRLQTDYVDLLLIHWPNRDVPLEETLGAMAELREQGRTRHIGVSNFTVRLVREAVAASPVPLFCNQVEYHPYLSQQPVLEACRGHDVTVVGYCPLARGQVFDEPVLREIGERHGKSGGQVALRWLVQQDRVGAIPRSSSREHIRSNFDIWDFQLDEREMERIHGLACGERLVDGGGNPTPDWDT